MAADPKNVRISQFGDEVSESLKKEGYVDTQLDAYRLAISVALALDLGPDPAPVLDHNKWDSAAVFMDGNSNMASLIDLFYPGTENPVLIGIGLAENGLKWLENKRLSGVDIWLELHKLGLLTD